MRSRRALALAIGLVMAVAGVAQGASPAPKVTGSYTYTSVSGPKAVSVDANGTDPVKGTWSFTNLANGVERGGPVTCLVIEGADAFMFGPATIGDRAAFLWVRDGGEPGKDDEAVTWIQDPGQPLSEMEDWCRNAGAGFPAELLPLDSGNLVIHEGS